MEIGIEGENTEKLFEASLRGCVSTLDILLERDPLILGRISLSSFTETPLHIASLLGHLDFTEALLHHKPDLSAELNSQGQAPLHLASAEGHTGIVKALLRVNAHVCLVPDQVGRIPLHLATMRGRVEVIRELVHACPASVNLKLYGQEKVLHLCIRYNHLQALQLLLTSVINESEFINSADRNGHTILQLAVSKRQIETVKYLVSIPGVRVEAEELAKLFSDQQLVAENLQIQDCMVETTLARNQTEHHAVPPQNVIRNGEEPGNSRPDAHVIRNGEEPGNFRPDAHVIQIRNEEEPGNSRSDAHVIRNGEETGNSRPDAHVIQIRNGEERGNSRPDAHVIQIRNGEEPGNSRPDALLSYLDDKGKWLEKRRGNLMIVATVIATLAFQVAMNPPGGVWQTDAHYNDTDQKGCLEDVCKAGTSIFSYNNDLYYAFTLCNTISFSASLSTVILLLLREYPLKGRLFVWILLMCIALFFMSATYIISIRLVAAQDNWGINLIIFVYVFFWGFLFSLLALYHLLFWPLKKLLIGIFRGKLCLCKPRTRTPEGP